MTIKETAKDKAAEARHHTESNRFSVDNIGKVVALIVTLGAIMASYSDTKARVDGTVAQFSVIQGQLTRIEKHFDDQMLHVETRIDNLQRSVK